MLPFEDRYTRQRQLPQVGSAGQERIAQLRVDLAQSVGCEVARSYLKRAGVAQVNILPHEPVLSCAHTDFFRFVGPREVGLGAHAALRCILTELSRPPSRSELP